MEAGTATCPCWRPHRHRDKTWGLLRFGSKVIALLVSPTEDRTDCKHTAWQWILQPRILSPFHPRCGLWSLNHGKHKTRGVWGAEITQHKHHVSQWLPKMITVGGWVPCVSLASWKPSKALAGTGGLRSCYNRISACFTDWSNKLAPPLESNRITRGRKPPSQQTDAGTWKQVLGEELGIGVWFTSVPKLTGKLDPFAMLATGKLNDQSCHSRGTYLPKSCRGVNLVGPSCLGSFPADWSGYCSGLLDGLTAAGE